MPEAADDIAMRDPGYRPGGGSREADEAYDEYTEEWKEHLEQPWVAEGRPPRRSDFRKGDYGGKWQEASRAYEAAVTQYQMARFRRLEEGAPTAADLAYEPELEGGVEDLGPSAAGVAEADIGSIEAQRRALAQMEEIYQQGGYTDIEREQIEQAMMQARNLERAGTQAARQQMAARGMVGSGAQVGAQMAAQQGAMNRGRGAATDIAAAGQARALDALGGAGRVSGQMRGQSWEEAHGRGTAIDDFRKDAIQYQRDKEQRRAEAQTLSNKALGEARGQEFENLWGLTRDEIATSQAGQARELANKQRIDAIRQGNISAGTNLLGSAVDLTAMSYGMPPPSAASGGTTPGDSGEEEEEPE